MVEGSMIDPNDPNVPIVGQPYRVITWYPTVIIACHCQDKGIALVINTGVGNYTACGQCKKLYTIQGFNEKGELMVGMMLPTPTGAVM
jgi:hypothetical protein